MRKVLGIAYVRKIFSKIFFGDAGFRRNGADELLHKRLRQASAPRRAMRKPLGIAYVGTKFFLKNLFSEHLWKDWRLSFETFGKVSKLFQKLINIADGRRSLWHVDSIGDCLTFFVKY